jgi:hypothetical protein
MFEGGAKMQLRAFESGERKRVILLVEAGCHEQRLKRAKEARDPGFSRVLRYVC